MSETAETRAPDGAARSHADGAQLTLRPPDAADRARKEAARATWEEDRARLVFEQPFLASLTLHLDLIPVMDDRVRTACTDGQRVFVDVDFLESLDSEERLFVLAHETWHCALRHQERQGDREDEAWNVAIDHEVNAILLSLDLTMPRCGGIYFPTLDGRSAEEVFAHLEALAHLEPYAQPPTRGPDADLHLGPAGLPPLDTGGPPGRDEDPRIVRYDPDCAPYFDPETPRRWAERVVEAAQLHERRFGTLPRALRSLVNRILKPTVPWRELLRQFVTRSYGAERSWLPPSRRYVSRGLYLPSLRQDTLHLTVAIDTSGSTVAFWPDFAAELAALVGSFGRYRLRVLLCDTEIQGEAVYTDDAHLDPDQALPMGGGGGTSFVPVFARLAEGEQEGPLVYLTDGEGPAPTHAPRYPVLWALTPGGVRPTPWGEVVHLPPSSGSCAAITGGP